VVRGKAAEKDKTLFLYTFHFYLLFLKEARRLRNVCRGERRTGRLRRYVLLTRIYDLNCKLQKQSEMWKNLAPNGFHAVSIGNRG
jgi:hypothetical protein